MSVQDRRTSLSSAQIDALWTPQADESELWQGKPDPLVLARTAFRVRWIAGYFAVLALTALVVKGGPIGSLAMIGTGLAVLAILYGVAFLSARTTTYILTDRRVILHIGMAIEKTINLPLSKIGAAHMADKGHGFGEIALEPEGEHTLGYLLLWPHARPWRLARPQPMLRAVPQAATVAETLADAVAVHKQIARGDGEPKRAAAPSATRTEPAMHGAIA